MSGADQKPARLRLVPASETPAHVAQPLTIDEALGIHLDALYGAARMLTGDTALAEDLVQETALRAFTGWGNLRSTSAVKPWLLRTLYRLFLNERRRDARRPPLVDIDIDELVTHPLLSVEPIATIADGMSSHVAEALDALPLGFRETVWLLDVEELSLAEAADVLALPVGTVASRAHRARRLLREHLHDPIGRRRSV